MLRRLHNVTAKNQDTQEFSQWLGDNYHPGWDLVPLLKEGFAIHHGALPRSVAYHLLRKFNEGSIRFLLCTSTIIEGVNTAAENIIIYDNKVATRKFDFFTFNNIKGRAGRMLRHFVGHVYVLNYEIQQELPFVDIPVLTQPDDAPESLLIHIDDQELSEHSRWKLRHLHAQNYLPMEIICENAGISPEGQVRVAETIATNLNEYHRTLVWHKFPTNQQRQIACDLIFEHLMGSKGFDGIFSAKQMSYKIGKFSLLKEIKNLIKDEIENNKHIDTPTKAVEEVLVFLRRWAEFHFPRYLSALDKIQRHVFSEAGMSTGNYEGYVAEIKRLFMPLSATVLEEYGVPYQISLKLEKCFSLGDTVDDVLAALAKLNVKDMKLSSFEEELLSETIDNL